MAIDFGGIEKGSSDFGAVEGAMKLPDFDEVLLQHYKELGDINIDNLTNSLISLSQIDFKKFW